MDSEDIVNQVLEEIRQSITMISETFNKDKDENSSIYNFSISSLLEYCEIHIVDELPSIPSYSNEEICMIPCQELNNENYENNCNNPSSIILMSSLISDSIDSSSTDTYIAPFITQEDYESTSAGSCISDDSDIENIVYDESINIHSSTIPNRNFNEGELLSSQRCINIFKRSFMELANQHDSTNISNTNNYRCNNNYKLLKYDHNYNCINNNTENISNCYFYPELD
ncbi:uncharacterized protein CMU_030880 [Cryptosporidium muris RN66]|uniref:Uncharacterized protein n=1 Tax=Cryptosporidium muris (strain RN66) TaxID=441375 RepID=B6AIA6_CRYMR|nr:uncharacterized protein CMU_030880 [Cryptosporidium muris RN66]EEA07947.1 hypothetical protein, conserved [Cryptosporidium muris RN66]|eukprot:XP_002142296.1 hypothetical protein [Cryptosporidium muris RN66]